MSDENHVCEPIFASEHWHTAKGSGYEANWKERKVRAKEDERYVCNERGVDKSRGTVVGLRVPNSPTGQVWEAQPVGRSELMSVTRTYQSM